MTAPGAQAERGHLLAQNARAARIAFVVAGACGEFALQPLLPILEWLALLALFVVVGVAAIALPFDAPKPVPGAARPSTGWPVRQVVAVVVIGLAGVEALTRLRPGRHRRRGSARSRC